jgi:dUTP pyrophosphatase
MSLEARMEKLSYYKVRDVKDLMRAHPGDAGIDFFIPFDFNGGEPFALLPQQRVLIPAGVKVDVPFGHALVMFNKSGVGARLGLSALACVIDHGYQGEVHISVVNTGSMSVTLKGGMKIIQALLLPVSGAMPTLVEEGSLYEGGSSRGDGGFGSSGI